MINTENLSLTINKTEILRDITISFDKGKIHGLIGRNGSGKTMLMKCICGFMRQDKGKVYVNGAEIGKDEDFPESLGMIIETPGFLPNVSGYKNLKILADLRSMVGRQEIRASIAKVGLDPDMRKPVSKYSLGMRQRLGIAQAIMENPDVLILDEPFNGLDKNTVLKMRKLILDLRDQGKAILLASHNAVDIEELCDRVYEMEIGVPPVSVPGKNKAVPCSEMHIFR